MQSVHRTNKTSLRIPFWDAFTAKYYIEPLYTGVGSYDAVKISANVVNNIQIQYPTGALIGLLMNVIYQDFRPSIKCKVYKR